MTRVAVLGASGKMGSSVCKAVLAAPEFELTGAVDPAASGKRLSELGQGIDSGIVVGASIDELDSDNVDAVVDFTVAHVAVENMTWCAQNSVHVVCGTTGIGADGIARLSALFAPSDRPNAIIAPNFAISAVVMMRLCELAAGLFDGVEIIELHHNEKADAPSGTALETARRIAKARGAEHPFQSDPTTNEALHGARGGQGDGDIHVHSIRLPGLVAHQEVLFGALGQTLSIRQDSYDRSSFMPGVLLALRKVGTMPGLTIGLDALLDF